MLGEATRRQFSLTLERVRQIAADNNEPEKSQNDARSIQRILEAFDLDLPSQVGVEPNVPVALRNEWQSLKAIVLTVDTPPAQLGHAARTMRQAEALGRALAPVPRAAVQDERASCVRVQEPKPKVTVATTDRGLQAISNYDEAEKLAIWRGAPAATDLALLVPFFLISLFVGETFGLFFFPSAGGFGLLNAATLTGVGYSHFRGTNLRRSNMIKVALTDIKKQQASA